MSGLLKIYKPTPVRFKVVYLCHWKLENLVFIPILLKPNGFLYHAATLIKIHGVCNTESVIIMLPSVFVVNGTL